MDAGVSCDLVVTEHPGHAADLASSRGSAYDAVFVLGGDGTAMEVATELAGTGRPIGVLPAGTGNLLARALGIPMNLRGAVRALLSGHERWMDVARFPSGRGFIIAAGVGVDAAMVERTPPWLKRRFGVLGYSMVATAAAIGAVVRREFFSVTAHVDGEPCGGTAAAVMVANFGAVLGNRIVLGPGISPDDGLLDLCVYSPRNVSDALRVGWRMVRKDFSPDPAVLYRRGKRIRVETVPPRVYQADGDLLGNTPFEVIVQPRAALLLTPGTR